jgi:hypothetical protein
VNGAAPGIPADPARRVTASRLLRVAAALSAALMVATLAGAVRQPAVSSAIASTGTP